MNEIYDTSFILPTEICATDEPRIDRKTPVGSMTIHVEQLANFAYTTDVPYSTTCLCSIDDVAWSIIFSSQTQKE